MADEMQRLIVSLEANAKKFENAMAKANAVANQRARQIEKRFQDLNRNVSASFKNMLMSGVAIGGTSLGASEIAQYADAWTEAGNKINAAAQSAGVQVRSLSELRQSADEARTSFELYTDLYAKLIRAASGVAKSEMEVATATDLVAKSLKAGGASAQEQASTLTQLGQALGSGILQGDELRSLRENAPILIKAIADEFKTTVAGLKELGSEGKITSDRVFKAILGAQEKIEAQFAKTNATIADSFTLLKNNLTEYIGATAQAYGVTETINSILRALAGNIDHVANAAAAAGVVLAATFGRGALIAGVAALANPFVAVAAAIGAAAFALSAFGDDIRPIQGELATLQDYAAVLWENIASGVTGAADEIRNGFVGAVDLINEAMAGAGVSMADFGEVAKGIVNGVIGAFSMMYDSVVIAFTSLPGVVAEAVVNAVNGMVALVEAAINKVIVGINRVGAALNGLSSSVGGPEMFGEIGTVDLGRVENQAASAGKAAGEAFSEAYKRASQDHVGKLFGGIKEQAEGAFNAVRQQANDRAATRAINESVPFNPLTPIGAADKDAGYGVTVLPPITVGGGSGGGGGKGRKSGGGGGRKGRGSDYEREIEKIKERTAALQAETEAQRTVNPLIDDYGLAATRAKTAQELLTAAQESGLAVGKELTSVTQLLAGNFDGLSPKAREQAQAMLALANGYATASAEAERLGEAQGEAKRAADEISDAGKDAVKGFISDLREGKSATEALSNALDKVLDKLIDMSIDWLFDMGGGGGGILGLVGKIFGMKDGGRVERFADGGGVGRKTGRVRGAGGPRDDKILAHLSNGEFVVNTRATKRYGPMLEAINDGRLPAFANGGLVGRMPGLSASARVHAPANDNRRLHVTVGVSADQNGNLLPFVESVTERGINRATPGIIQASVKQGHQNVRKNLAAMMTDVDLRGA